MITSFGARVLAVARSARVRGLALLLLLLAATAWFLHVAERHYPAKEWLFWTYARAWLWAGLLTLACAAAGLALTSWLMPVARLGERLVMGMTLGLLVFFIGAFAAGLLGLYGTTFFFAWPLLMTAAAAPWALPRLRRFRRRVPSRACLRPMGLLAAAVAAFGVGSVAMIYFATLTPDNAAFDSRFYHLGIAQQYFVEGAIRPSPEGWTPSALPHLASVIYAWGFMAPRATPFERVIIAAHLEMAIFVWTLASIPVLVRWMVPRARVDLSWVAMFLFPGIFLYDSSPSIAADHVCAFFAVPILLALRRAWRELDPRACLLLAAAMAGALDTKYQGVMVCALPIAALAARTLQLSLRRSTRARAWIGPTCALVAGLVLTAPHWLKNWAFYGDPLFPYLYSKLGAARWPVGAHEIFAGWFTDHVDSWRPKGTLSEKLLETAKATFTFSFEPHDWPKFHGKRPVFGSLFTLFLPALAFVRGPRARTAVVFAAGHVAVVVWYWTMHQDRYLQAALPWMAAAVAGTIALAWRTHPLARAGVALLVALQVVWGADVYFIPGHAMMGDAPVKRVATLLALGHQRRYEQRFAPPDGLFRVGETLPPDAVVLLHEHNPRLGIFRRVVSDFIPWQMGLRYASMESPGVLHDRLTALGITHIAWREKSRGFDSLGGDLRFFDYVMQWAAPPAAVGGWRVSEIAPEAPPAADEPDLVAYLGCGKIYQRGLHPLTQMRAPGKAPPPHYKNTPALEPADGSTDIEDLLSRADYVVTEDRCAHSPPAESLDDFVSLISRGKEELWARKRF